MSIRLSLWTIMQSCSIYCIRLIISELHCIKLAYATLHNQVSSMYMACKAFVFYQFPFGANKQIFLLVNSHLFPFFFGLVAAILNP